MLKNKLYLGENRIEMGKHFVKLSINYSFLSRCLSFKDVKMFSKILLVFLSELYSSMGIKLLEGADNVDVTLVRTHSEK